MLTYDQIRTPKAAAFDAAVNCRVNMRYYERLIRYLGITDLSLRIAGAIASSAAFATALQSMRHGPLVIAILSAFAAVAAAAGPVLALSERARIATGLHTGYLTVLQRLEQLFEEGRLRDDSEYTDELRAIMQELHAVERREAEGMPTRFLWLFRRTEAAAHREMTRTPTPA